METANQEELRFPPVSIVPSGKDRFGEVRDIGISAIAFKVTHAESTSLFIVENMLYTKGGPARHIHHNQDEWFFVRQGEFTIEVGHERILAKPGDSLWAPRGVVHVWAYMGGGGGSILFAFNPPGKMESFFHELVKLGSVAPLDPELFRAHEMELVGPPLEV